MVIVVCLFFGCFCIGLKYFLYCKIIISLHHQKQKLLDGIPSAGEEAEREISAMRSYSPHTFLCQATENKLASREEVGKSSKLRYQNRTHQATCYLCILGFIQSIVTWSFWQLFRVFVLLFMFYPDDANRQQSAKRREQFYLIINSIVTNSRENFKLERYSIIQQLLDRKQDQDAVIVICNRIIRCLYDFFMNKNLSHNTLMSYNTYNVELSSVYEIPGSLVQLLDHQNLTSNLILRYVSDHQRSFLTDNKIQFLTEKQTYFTY